MELTAKNVREIMDHSLFAEGEIPDGLSDPERLKWVEANGVVVKGIIHIFAFHRERLASHKADLASMIEQVPNQFRKAQGGWSFLNLCNRKDDQQWGEHRDMEIFMCLAIGAGLASYPCPREMWPHLYGGMPYIMFD